MSHHVARNEPVKAREIEDLRAAVGWERLEGKYERILANTYAHFSVRDDQRLLAFVNVTEIHQRRGMRSSRIAACQTVTARTTADCRRSSVFTASDRSAFVWRVRTS